MKKHFFLPSLLLRARAWKNDDLPAKTLRVLTLFLAAALLTCLLTGFPGLLSSLNNRAVLPPPPNLQQHSAGGIFSTVGDDFNTGHDGNSDGSSPFNAAGDSGFNTGHDGGGCNTVSAGNCDNNTGNGSSDVKNICGGSIFYDFAAFKEVRLRLPEKREPFPPAVLGERILFLRGFAPGPNGLRRYGVLERGGCQAGAPESLFQNGPHSAFILLQTFCTQGNPGESSDPGILPEARSLVQGQSGSGQPDWGRLSGYKLIQSRRCDLDGDGITEEYTLRDGVVTVQAGSRLLWQSPENWWVDYFFLGDADNDGLPELNLLVWKEGSFGPHRPFWVDGEDTAVKNHLFIFRLAEGRIKPVWQSSNLDCPIHWATLADLDGDGENELVAIEGSYVNPQKKETTLWKWNGWGFYRCNY